MMRSILATTGVAVVAAALAAACGGDDATPVDWPDAAPPLPLGGLPTASYTTALGDDPADVYYPTDAEPGPFPVAVFLQGGRVDKREYASFAGALAAWGFVVVVPNHHNVVMFPGFEAEGLFSEQQQILDTVVFARAEAAGDGPAAAAIDPSRLAVLGHSYGAAAALAAIQGVCEFPFCPEDGAFAIPPELLGMALLGINTKPRVGSTEIRRTDNAGMPIAIINGRLDSNATAEDTELSFERIEDAPKGLVFIEGANHYALCDRNNPEGPARDPAEPTLEQAESVALSARYAALWLRASGMGDAAARAALEAGEPRVTTRFVFRR
jgi:dienelactone hydrolase